ncbi:MAG TPA: ribonuclease T2 [Bauldia sp.]|nr:ribonuclease T2 [Bauldia sp.]
MLLAAAPVAADGRAGDFDFYVLSLSWTPEACASGQASREECDAPHGFLVHGFWPEYETGYPDYCPANQPARVPQAILDGVDDVMPSTGLAGYEWRKHGICSGLSPAGYFALLGKAARKIATPQLLTPGNIPSQPTPAKIEAAFVSANPGLAAAGMAVRCANNTLTEVRICLTKELAFRPCPEINADTCHARLISVTPIP